MKAAKAERYRAQEFARRAGVTVRALHHYDRLGLLRPRNRSASGHRLYAPDDFGRLQQIVTLKFIGFPLCEIKKLLAGADLAAALRLQRRALEEKRSQLNKAIAAIADAERLAGSRVKLDARAFTKIIEAIRMQTNKDWFKKYYSEEAQALLAERRQHWNPELQAKATDDWLALFKAIEAVAAKGEKPDGEAGQAIAEKHARLIEAFTGGHTSIGESLGKLWADRDNWPEDFKKQVFEPFAQRGLAAAQQNEPRMLSDAGRDFLQAALKAYKAKLS